MRIKFRQIESAIDYLIGLLLIYASISKILEYDFFVKNINKNPLLNNNVFINLIPFFLFVEFSAGILLLFREYLQNIIIYINDIVVLFLLSYFLFLISTIYFLLPEYDIPCSCGGILGEMSYFTHLIFNLGTFLLFSFQLFYIRNNYLK